MKKAVIGIGTNTGNRETNLIVALDNISEQAGTVTLKSSVYETEPWGFVAEQKFLNMSVLIETELIPRDLLATLLKIESSMGRTRARERYASRVIDLDILLYGNEIINEPELIIPHPLIAARKFVLCPLCDIIPFSVHPVYHHTFKTLLKNCSDEADVHLHSMPLSAKL
jgi:2-amino-4-hydroxy-6-hydroxymethyldihydropteridine diphosphokinase